MRVTWDWKFFVMLVITALSGAFPVWYYYADQSARSLKFQVVSQTPLLTEGAGKVNGLKITLDGTDLVEPYLSLVVLSNAGTKPILAADFESEVEIQLGKAQAVSVDATGHPADLKPVLNKDDGRVRLKGLLLNPADLIRLSIVSKGAKPDFSAHGRVAGIKQIDTAEERPSMVSGTTVRHIVAQLLWVVYAAMVAMSIGTRPFRFKPLGLIAGTIACVGGIFVFPSDGTASVSVFASTFIPPVVVGVIIAIWAEARKKKLAKERSE